MSENRRDQPRVKHALPVRMRYGGAQMFLDAYSADISLGGIQIPSNAEVPIGTRVALTIELAPGKGFSVDAEVAWCKPAGGGNPGAIGLRFLSLDPRYASWLEKAVEGLRAQKQQEAPQKKADDQRSHLLRGVVGSVQLEDSEVDLGLQGMSQDTPILGIDLGTCNSCAAAFVAGEVIILELEPDVSDGSRTLPSVVSFAEDGVLLVGRDAQARLSKAPTETVFGSKRFMGRAYDHPEVQTLLQRYPYRVVRGGGGKVAVEIGSRSVSLTSVAAKILGAVKAKAEAALSSPVERAIITVPAFYNQNQRHAVVQAGRMAGITVERVLNEPTAAAIAYGLSTSKERTLVVYDLGGEDFDYLIMNKVRSDFEKKTGQRVSRNHVNTALLVAAVERAKVRLSTRPQSMVTLREIQLHDGSKVRFEMTLEVADVEAVVQPLVDRTLKISALALQEAGLDRQSVGEIIMVGGQTLMPYVRLRVEKFFGRRPRWDLAADEVVALGAGMLSHLQGTANTLEFDDALSISIGFDGGGGRFQKLVPRNTVLPARAQHIIEMPAKDLAGFSLGIYQGESDQIARNEHLGDLDLSELKSRGTAPTKVKIDFVLSPDCLLKVRATNLSTEQEVDILLNTHDTGM